MTKRNRTKRYNKGFSETGASRTRKSLKSFNPQSGSPNEDIIYNLYELRTRARTLTMAGGLPLSALKTNRTNVIGCGLVLKSHIDREVLGMTEEEAIAWQNNTEREFALWAENKNHCDALGLNDYYKLQQLAFYSALLSGDCATVIQRDEKSVTKMLPYSLRLNIIESDRISTPNSFVVSGILRNTEGVNSSNGYKIHDGVEVDKQGKVVAYHISNNYPGEITDETTVWTRVSAFGKETGLPNIIFNMQDIERPGQYRGLPLIAPVIESILQIRRYTDSELMAAVVESLFTAFIKTEARTDEIPFNEVDQGEQTIQTNENEYEMGPGNAIIMKPGEDVTFADPKRPAGGFPAFVEAVAVQIGASLEIPKEMLLKQFNSSYSASRAALLEFWKLVKMRREWFVSDWCRPIYEVWMYEAVARGRIKAPGFFNDPIIRMAWLGSDFIGPAQGMLDPTKEITAEEMMCENGFSTRSDSAIKLNGSEFIKNVASLGYENQILAQANSSQRTADLKNEYINASVGGQSET